MKWKHWKHPFGYLVAVGAGAVWARGWWILAVFACGFLLGVLAHYAVRLAGRLMRRLDWALPDRRDRPLSEDPDYLDGVERGIRGRRRSAGYEDGRLAEDDRMNQRGFA